MTKILVEIVTGSVLDSVTSYNGLFCEHNALILFSLRKMIYNERNVKKSDCLTIRP